MAEKIDEWREIIAECQASELSQKTFCRERNISFSTFQYWRTKIRKQDSASSETSDEPHRFVRCSMPPLKTEYTLEWRDGMRLRFPPNAPLDDIAALTERFRKIPG